MDIIHFPKWNCRLAISHAQHAIRQKKAASLLQVPCVKNSNGWEKHHIHLLIAGSTILYYGFVVPDSLRLWWSRLYALLVASFDLRFFVLDLDLMIPVCELDMLRDCLLFALNFTRK